MALPAQKDAKLSLRRKQILDSALALFAKKGYDATPVPAIAKACKLAVGGLYRYYSSKEELVNAVYRRSKLLFGQFLLDGFHEKKTVRAKFQHVWIRMEAFSVEHSDDFLFLELHNHSGYLDENSLTLDTEVRQPIVQFIREAQKSGHMSSRIEPNLIMFLVVGIFLGCYKAHQGGLLSHSRKAFQQAEEAAWRAVKA